MSNIRDELHRLKGEVDQAADQLQLDEVESELNSIKNQVSEPDFWSDTQEAQEVVKRQAALETRLQPWQELQKQLADAVELASLGDESLSDELDKNLQDIRASFEVLKDQLKLAGPYDDHDAFLSIFAGAGGTDAQDWAQMLLRMYVRWAEKNEYKVATIDESAGEEAGLKSVTIAIEGPFAYGKLKGEHGVHRLVRLSPFNADNLRQTSFARVEIMPKINRPTDVELDDKDLKIDVYRSGGHGGQSVNTTDSAVRITHLPTGITVAIQNERSQLQNKDTALTILRSRLAQLQLEQHKDKISELKGPNEQAAWGNQIRNYVLHPYKQVKDVRTGHESKDPDKVLDGELDDFIEAYLEQSIGDE